jgi:hypothetical protein
LVAVPAVEDVHDRFEFLVGQVVGRRDVGAPGDEPVGLEAFVAVGDPGGFE